MEQLSSEVCQASDRCTFDIDVFVPAEQANIFDGGPAIGLIPDWIVGDGRAGIFGVGIVVRGGQIGFGPYGFAFIADGERVHFASGHATNSHATQSSFADWAASQVD